MITEAKTRTRLLIGLAGLGLVTATLPLWLGARPTQKTEAMRETEVVRAQFTSEGAAVRPDNWRSWTFIGAPVTPNALNGGEAPFPEFHNVYIEPTAFESYQMTGQFPEGTQLAKELVSVISDAAHEDGSTVQVSGRGYFQGEFQGLELAVKESSRFPDEPGGWAYFSFGHQSEPYAESATAFPAAGCNACHQVNAAQDWVFTQFYPLLREIEFGPRAIVVP